MLETVAGSISISLHLHKYLKKKVAILHRSAISPQLLVGGQDLDPPFPSEIECPFNGYDINWNKFRA